MLPTSLVWQCTEESSPHITRKESIQRSIQRWWRSKLFQSNRFSGFMLRNLERNLMFQMPRLDWQAVLVFVHDAFKVHKSTPTFPRSSCLNRFTIVRNPWQNVWWNCHPACPILLHTQNKFPDQSEYLSGHTPHRSCTHLAPQQSARHICWIPTSSIFQWFLVVLVWDWTATGARGLHYQVKWARQPGRIPKSQF